MHVSIRTKMQWFLGQQNFKWTLRRGEGGRSDLNVQLTLSGGKVNMSTALYVFNCSFISYHLQTYLASFCTSAFSIMNLAYVAFTYTTSALWILVPEVFREIFLPVRREARAAKTFTIHAAEKTTIFSSRGCLTCLNFFQENRCWQKRSMLFRFIPDKMASTCLSFLKKVSLEQNVRNIWGTNYVKHRHPLSQS